MTLRPGLTFWRLAMTLTMVALGFLVVIQSRAGRTLTSQVPVPTRNVYALATLLREEREARLSLESQVTELRRQLETYERAASEGRSLQEAMGRELETLRVALGLKAMRGPGVIVRLADPKTPPKGPTPVVVNYQDIVAVVNELWAAGAEAIAVNGQRISATTGLNQVGGTIVVNLQRLTGPFEIVAIGDPATLEGALKIRGGLIEGLRALGLTIHIFRRDALTVPPYKGPLTFEYAKPVE
ncbi:MAG: DUF881 domain-containing protein [Armatimonadota bacterium]|nr:DUF881 domain-containing protein [Armatimonadota bacterium]MDR7452081.1 DUF881 domain-containing protein [Armatimonadota bacterium]MDR7466543.1 DUF881 domain-containing protein [Armatimonadota bacterium]MDR7493265.1 DUF881 domain-containing protein [Armatimonadota bacterium]MDR7499842.1 DUF881 domain-containing protein [Armatimonadota bacterium]